MITKWVSCFAAILFGASTHLQGGNCNAGSPGTTVFYVNGVNTTLVDAELDLGKLQDRVVAAVNGTPKSTECLVFKSAYNETGGLEQDLWQSTRQRLNQDLSLFLRN